MRAVADPIDVAAPSEWNAWLAANTGAGEVWVLFHKKATGIPSMTWEQSVIEALAHGWIDGIKKSVSDTQWIQRFTPRRAGSAWSQKNVAQAEKLIAEGRMTAAGLAHVTLAKQNGRWVAAHAGGQAGDLPKAFLEALAANAQASATYASLDAKNRFAIYYRLTSVKREETRARKAVEFVAMLARGEKLI
jgi:uncharacterized protein YdeI (YjbR/CyaY-like superfamily)